MMKKAIIVFVVLVIAILAYWMYGNKVSAPVSTETGKVAEVMGDTKMEESHLMEDGTVMEGKEMVENSIMTKEAGHYEDYTPEEVSEHAKTGKVVLFFKASWCPTCRAVDKDIMANLGKIPGDVSVLKVDYDNSTELKKKYGVTYQHTFVQVDKDGNMIKKWSSSPTLKDLLLNIM
jgi:thiol-disulfide isomerase/thioredoxin